MEPSPLVTLEWLKYFFQLYLSMSKCVINVMKFIDFLSLKIRHRYIPFNCMPVYSYDRSIP